MPVEECLADLPLQRMDVPGHGGLSRMERGGGSPNRSIFGDGGKRGEELSMEGHTETV